MIMKTWRTWWWEWSSILKVLKVTSLQCLYNISKKKLWREFIMVFTKIKFSTSCIIDFWWNQASIQKKSLLSFYNILRKSIVTVFAFYCDVKYSYSILCKVPVMFVIPCFCNIPTVSILPSQSQLVVCYPKCSVLNQFILVFTFLTKTIFIFT